MRDYSLDLAKFIAIFFVIIYHNSWALSTDIINDSSVSALLTYYFNSILSTCVPLFFLVNGALVINKKFNLNQHVRKIIKLVALTLIWAVIIVVCISLIRHESLSLKRAVQIISQWQFGYVHSLWFMHTLIIIYLFFPLIKTAKDYSDQVFKYLCIIVFIFTFGNVLIDILADTIQYYTGVGQIDEGYKNYFNSINAFKGWHSYALAYFLLGAIIYNKTDKAKIAKYRYLIIPAIFISMLGLTGYGYVVSIGSRKYYDVVFAGYQTIFTAINTILIFLILKIYADKLLFARKIVTLISQNTLGIYFLQGIIIEWSKPLFRSFMPKTIFTDIAISLMILVISLLICLCAKKIPVIQKLFTI